MIIRDRDILDEVLNPNEEVSSNDQDFLLVFPNENPKVETCHKVIVVMKTYFFPEDLDRFKKELGAICTSFPQKKIYFLVCIADIKALCHLADACPNLQVVNTVCVTDSVKFKASIRMNCSKGRDLLSEGLIAEKVLIKFKRYFFKKVQKRVGLVFKLSGKPSAEMNTEE